MSGPDENINVVAVYPDGLATVYGHLSFDAARPIRAKLYSRQFPTYGHACEWADAYETQGRLEAARRSR